jgi:hypothetical protein
MWTLIVAGYLIGTVATAVAIRRERMVEAGRVVEATCSVLWPLYWGILSLVSYRERRLAARKCTG